jgi:hypothetical protein
LHPLKIYPLLGTSPLAIVESANREMDKTAERASTDTIFVV